MPRLGALLLEEKLIQPAQLEEALETQVIHGGRLGTNLVELGFLKEADLARVLGRQHNLPYASGEMVPDPQALALHKRQFYDDSDVLPMRMDATRLTVVVLNPRQVQPLEELAFRASKRVVAVVIPEFRMNQLLRAHCKAFRPIRPIDLNTLRPTKALLETKNPSAADAVGLINEDDFAKLYAHVAAGGTAEVEEEVIEGVAMEEAPPPPEPEVSPLTFAEAQKHLLGSTGREDIALTVLRFAKSKFLRAMLLNVQGPLVTGWHGIGRGVKDRNVARIGVNLKEDNTFRMVSELKSHFTGPMKKTPGIDQFYTLLGAKGVYPATAVILPLLVRGRLVHLLYVDNGPIKPTPPDVGELLILSQSVTRSYEALITARKVP